MSFYAEGISGASVPSAFYQCFFGLARFERAEVLASRTAFADVRSARSTAIWLGGSVLGAMEDKAATELTLTAYDDAVMKQASTKLESNQFVAFGVKLTR